MRCRSRQTADIESERRGGSVRLATACVQPTVDAIVSASSPPRSVAIAENQPITRSGLEQLAASIPGLLVTASVASVDELDLSESAYDMVVMDVPAREDG